MPAISAAVKVIFGAGQAVLEGVGSRASTRLAVERRGSEDWTPASLKMLSSTVADAARISSDMRGIAGDD